MTTQAPVDPRQVDIEALQIVRTILLADGWTKGVYEDSYGRCCMIGAAGKMSVGFGGYPYDDIELTFDDEESLNASRSWLVGLLSDQLLPKVVANGRYVNQHDETAIVAVFNDIVAGDLSVVIQAIDEKIEELSA